MNEQEKKITYSEELEKNVDPLEKIRALEQTQIESEKKWEAREKELLIEIASKVEVNKKSRESEAKALRAKEVAEYKYYNQQQAQIEGVKMETENTPQREAKKIFVDALRERRIKSQQFREKKADNVFYL